MKEEQRRATFNTLSWLMLAVTGVLLLYTGYLAYTALMTLGTDLQKAGWKFQSYTQFPFEFLFHCFNDQRCNQKIELYYLKYFSLIPAYVTGGALFLALYLKGQSIAPKIQKDPGQGGFANANTPKLQAYLRDTRKEKRSGYLGYLKTGQMVKPTLRMRCTNTLVVGGVGGGKTSGYFRPNLIDDALAGHTAVVIDLKYPDPANGFYDMIAVFAQAGRKVQVLAPFSENTMRLPLLIGTEQSQTAFEVASVIIPLPEDGKEESGSFYKKLERRLLAALIQAFAMRGEPNFRSIYREVLKGSQSVKDLINRSPDEVKEQASQLFEVKDDTLTGVLAGLASTLQIFDNEHLARATTSKDGENIDLQKVLTEPHLLYIGIPQDAIMLGNGQILLQLISRILTNSIYRVSESTGAVLKNHCAIYMDEFPSLGLIPNIIKILGTMRSRNVSYHLTLQNMWQARLIYGADGFNALTTSVIRHKLILPGAIDGKDAREFSDQLGYITVTETTNSTTRRGLDSSNSQTERKVSRPLVSPEEFWDYPNNEGIVLMTGCRPFQVILPRLDQPSLNGVRNELHYKYKNLMGPMATNHKMLITYTNKIIQNAGVKPDSKTEKDLLADKSPDELFQDWVSDMTRALPSMKVFNNDRPGVKIIKDTLPETLRDPNLLGIFTRYDWVHNETEHLKITTKGCEKIGTVRLKHLYDLSRAYKIYKYISEHSLELEGHPERDKLGYEKPKPQGRYEQESVWLPVETAKELLPSIPGDLKREKKDGTTLVRIPIGDAATVSRLMDEISETEPPENTKAGKTGPADPERLPLSNMRFADGDASKTNGHKPREHDASTLQHDQPSEATRSQQDNCKSQSSRANAKTKKGREGQDRLLPEPGPSDTGGPEETIERHEQPTPLTLTMTLKKEAAGPAEKTNRHADGTTGQAQKTLPQEEEHLDPQDTTDPPSTGGLISGMKIKGNLDG